MGIKGHRNMGGIFFIDEVDERIGKTKLSVCVPPSAGKPGTADKGVIGTVDQRHGIQEKNLFTHCAKVNNRKEAEKTKSSFMNFLKKCVSRWPVCQAAGMDGQKKNRHIEMRRRCYYLMKTLFADKYNVNGK
jgi:hypothetical protein